MTHLRFISDQIDEVEKVRLARLRKEPKKKSHAMVLLLARIRGLGIETADMLTHEVFLRNLRDRRAVPRYAALTGAPDESGEKRQEKGLAQAGNARVRRGMIELAWRFLQFQKESALAQWYWSRTADRRKDIPKIMIVIVALTRKLMIALWQMVTTGEIPPGVELRPHDYRIRA
jgi:transposase